jgi:hypothetical protein
MRDLINITTLYNLTESRGLGARRSGEEFVSTTNPEDKIYVNSVTFYPQDRGMYDSYQEMSTELKQAVNIPGAYVDLLGNFGTKDLAFGIAVFDKPDGSKLAFVKPYKSVNPDPTQNNWDNQKGIPGYRYNSKAAAKTQAGMTPQDILTDFNDQNPSGVVEQIEAKFGADSPLSQVARAVAAGQKLPIAIPADPAMSFTAFRDYFCELLHPIALHTGNYTGNAGDAAEKFLGVGGFANTAINFGTDKTEGLSDSILVAPDGKKIKVSSKGAKGAEASSTNIVNAAEELQSSNPVLLKKHAATIDLINDVKSGGQSGAPLLLGVRFKIIDEEDVDTIKNFRKMPPLPLEKGKLLGSKKLQALISGRNTDRPESVNMYFHSIAAVAHKVAEYVNKNTNFGQAASEILNNGALIQVYTKATEKGDQWTLVAFDTKWPSDTVTGVSFSASKNYFSTGIKGNFTFKVLRNGAKDVPDERSTEPVLAPSKVATPNVVSGKRVSIRPTRSEPAPGELGQVGREKR